MKKYFLMKPLLAAFVLLFSFQLWAGQALDFTIHQDYTSTRALGMGNAFTAIVDDHNAIFYNPAALALREDGVIRMFLRAGIGDGYLGLLDDIESASGESGEDEVNEMFEVIEDNYGEHFYSRVPTIGGVWARPNWGIAFIPADLSVDLAMHQQVGPAISVNAYLDTTFAYSYAQKANWFGKDHKLAWGVTGKALHRIFFSESLIAAELAQNSDVFQQSRAQEGLTVDADVGFLYSPTIPTSGWLSWLQAAKPTFAAVIRNVFDIGFPMNFNVASEDSEEPPKLQRRIDLGSKFDLPNFWVFDPKLAIDMKDMLHENWSLKKGFHMGAELYWKMFDWWKGSWAVGLNQGYYTMGLGARLAWFQIDVATWGEEVGTSSAPKESRRYMLELSLEF